MNLNTLSQVFTDENQFSREKLHCFFDKAFRENDEKHLRRLYVSLRQLELTPVNCDSMESVELTSLAEAVTIACDILAAPSGISFIFFGDTPCVVRGNRRLIEKSLLNLLSNAYLYGAGALVTVRAVSKNDATQLEVMSSGGFRDENPAGKGLDFVRKACQQMNGGFLIEQTATQTKAVMSLENSAEPCFKELQEDYIRDLVNDRLSPVCVEMFGMKYHKGDVKKAKTV